MSKTSKQSKTHTICPNSSKFLLATIKLETSTRFPLIRIHNLEHLFSCQIL